jgi:hypothetical protein
MKGIPVYARADGSLTLTAAKAHHGPVGMLMPASKRVVGYCAVPGCGKPQHSTPWGPHCGVDGHAGAPSLDAPPKGDDRRYDAVRFADDAVRARLRGLAADIRRRASREGIWAMVEAELNLIAAQLEREADGKGKAIL